MAPQLNLCVDGIISYHFLLVMFILFISVWSSKAHVKNVRETGVDKASVKFTTQNSVFRTVKNTRQEPALVAEAVPTLITWRDGCLLWHVTHLLIYVMDKGRSPWHCRDHFCYLSKIYKFNTSCVHTLLTVCCWKVRMVFGSALHSAQIWRVQTYWIFRKAGLCKVTLGFHYSFLILYCFSQCSHANILQYEKSLKFSHKTSIYFQHFQGGWTNTGMGTEDWEGKRCMGFLGCLVNGPNKIPRVAGCTVIASAILELDGRNGDDPGLKAKETVDLKSSFQGSVKLLHGLELGLPKSRLLKLNRLFVFWFLNLRTLIGCIKWIAKMSRLARHARCRMGKRIPWALKGRGPAAGTHCDPWDRCGGGHSRGLPPTPMPYSLLGEEWRSDWIWIWLNLAKLY